MVKERKRERELAAKARVRSFNPFLLFTFHGLGSSLKLRNTILNVD
jgi:hypothetical protein